MVSILRARIRKTSRALSSVGGGFVEKVIAVAEVDDLFEAQLFGQYVDFALVLEDGLAHRPRPALLVVGGLDQIGRVAFGDELGDEAGAEEGNIIRVGLDGGQHLALVGFVWDELFDGYFADGSVPGNAWVGTRGHGRFLLRRGFSTCHDR